MHDDNEMRINVRTHQMLFIQDVSRTRTLHPVEPDELPVTGQDNESECIYKAMQSERNHFLRQGS